MEGSELLRSWHAIQEMGRFASTYKIALGTIILDLAKVGLRTISRQELAERFFQLYVQRIESGMPQLRQSDEATLVEQIVWAYRNGSLDREVAVARVAQKAFRYVLPCFHRVTRVSVVPRFFEYDERSFALTDNAFELASFADLDELSHSLSRRWSELERVFYRTWAQSRLAVWAFHLSTAPGSFRWYSDMVATGKRPQSGTSLVGLASGVARDLDEGLKVVLVYDGIVRLRIPEDDVKMESEFIHRADHVATSLRLFCWLFRRVRQTSQTEMRLCHSFGELRHLNMMVWSPSCSISPDDTDCNPQTLLRLFVENYPSIESVLPRPTDGYLSVPDLALIWANLDEPG